LRALFAGAVAFWREPIRAEPLALFRILVGGTMLAMLFLSYLPRLGDDIGPDGLCPLEAVEPRLDRTHRFCLLRGPQNVPYAEEWFSAATVARWRDWGNTPHGALTLLAVWAVALVGLTLGAGTRLCALVAWALAVSFQARLFLLLNAGDRLYRHALFYLMIAPAGATWSVDSWLRWRLGWQPAGAALVPPWSVRLMQIHLAYLYLHTGLGKVWDGDWGEDWLSGEAIYWVLNDLAISRWSYLDVPVPMWLCKLASWGTLVFEIGFPLAVLFRRLRPWWLLAGVALHVGIFLTMEVGWFSQATLCWYALFLSPERCEALRAGPKWLYAKLRGWRRPAP
jgi:hypothetical protein